MEFIKELIPVKSTPTPRKRTVRRHADEHSFSAGSHTPSDIQIGTKRYSTLASYRRSWLLPKNEGFLSAYLLSAGHLATGTIYLC